MSNYLSILQQGICYQIDNVNYLFAFQIQSKSLSKLKERTLQFKILLLTERAKRAESCAQLLAIKRGNFVLQ